MVGDEIDSFSLRVCHVEQVTFRFAEVNEFPWEFQHGSLAAPTPEKRVVLRVYRFCAPDPKLNGCCLIERKRKSHLATDSLIKILRKTSRQVDILPAE
jgi:hypothetical protein